ncbi:uncharacterized protein FOMMEDRAFT_162378 [Fomitiporia mediterranea MF3/22]|uniref:uncharacterized protein n=1 Tax=Fomitiporia mediterranea (strain MF3/22) TaxID=694068 RepID=UPI0004409718|nr:uncharacterized protein FOMMEDRAFT_162378 [Fomitiporia mediterranea MF3/22]EJC98033.1 hypothetical protein FOMMEDRAFT_162378 [Fomitiporia mediterranea MF3/22]
MRWNSRSRIIAVPSKSQIASSGLRGSGGFLNHFQEGQEEKEKQIPRFETCESAGEVKQTIRLPLDAMIAKTPVQAQMRHIGVKTSKGKKIENPTIHAHEISGISKNVPGLSRQYAEETRLVWASLRPRALPLRELYVLLRIQQLSIDGRTYRNWYFQTVIVPSQRALSPSDRYILSVTRI